MFKVAFTTVTFRKLTRDAIAKLAFDCGVDDIEWGGDIHLPMGDTDAINEVNELNEKYKLHSLSYGSYYRVGDGDIAAFKDIVNTASAIGAKIIRVWLGKVSGDKTDKEQFNKMVAEVQTLADIAMEKHLKIAFEFHNGTYNDSGDNAIRFLLAVNKDNVGTYWQPLCNKADEQNLKKVLPYILGIHVFNWDRFSRRHSLRLGIKKWKRFIEIAKESNPEIPYIIEFVKGDNEKQFKKDIDTLKKLLNECYRQ